MAYGHDEEIGGNKGARKIAELLNARGEQLEFVLDEGGSVIEHGVIPGIDGSVALIGIAEKGYVSLKLSNESTGGHSSMPPRHSALGIIAQAIVNLENNPFPSNLKYSKQMFENIGPAMNTVEKAVFANMWIAEPIVERILSRSKTSNATIRTTTAVTMAEGSSKDNILPSVASAVVNFRIMPGETVQSVIAYVKDEIGVSVMGQFSDEPSPVSVSDNQNFRLIRDSIYRVTQDRNLIVTPYLVTGATDGRHFSALSNSIYRFAFNRFRPETLERMHGIDEQIKVDDYVDMVKFFRELILGANGQNLRSESS